MNYRDRYYYYQSSTDHFYLYKSDGKRNECLAKQVPKEIYPNNDWIYFTNASDGQTLYKICTDGTGMKQGANYYTKVIADGLTQMENYSILFER